MSDYDSDEAPEAVNFTTSKSLALKEVKAAAEAIKVSKEKDKEAKVAEADKVASSQIKDLQKSKRLANIRRLKQINIQVILTPNFLDICKYTGGLCVRGTRYP